MTTKPNILVLAAIFFAYPLHASELVVPNNFSAGSPAIADEVNDNFDATRIAVNDNWSQLQSALATIEALEDSIASLQAKVDSLEQSIATASPVALAYISSPRNLSDAFDDYTLVGLKPVFTIEFPIQVDQDSFAVGENIFISGSLGAGTATLSWLDEGRTLQINVVEDFSEISPCFSGGMTLEIQANGENAPTDVNGNAIDADSDGRPGGDWQNSYDFIC